MKTALLSVPAPEATVSTRRIEDLPDVISWIAHHDGMIEERWPQQLGSNKALRVDLDKLGERVSTVIRELHLKIDRDREKHATELANLRVELAEKVDHSNETQDKASKAFREEFRNDLREIWGKVWKLGIAVAGLAAAGGYGVSLFGG